MVLYQRVTDKPLTKAASKVTRLDSGKLPVTGDLVSPPPPSSRHTKKLQCREEESGAAIIIP